MNSLRGRPVSDDPALALNYSHAFDIRINFDKRWTFGPISGGDMHGYTSVGAGSTVSSEDVAIDADGALPEGFQIDRGTDTAPDETLDFVRPPALAPLRGLSRRARVRGPREHSVFGGDPSAPGAFEKRRNPFLDRSGAEDVRVAQRDQGGALGVARDARLDRDRAEIVGSAPVGPRRRAHGFMASASPSRRHPPHRSHPSRPSRRAA